MVFTIQNTKAKIIIKIKQLKIPHDRFFSTQLFLSNNEITKSNQIEKKIKSNFKFEVPIKIEKKEKTVKTTETGKLHYSNRKSLEFNKTIIKENKSNLNRGTFRDVQPLFKNNQVMKRRLKKREFQNNEFSIVNRKPKNENEIMLKIMDVDSIPIDSLHKLFLSQLVRW